MWEEVEKTFKSYPAQKKVAKYLLKMGFRVGKRNKVMCDNIELAHTQIGKEVGVDRRVVDAAVGRLLKNKKLMATMIKKIATALHDFPGYAKVRRVSLSLQPWTIEDGLVTPTLKIKRALVVKKFQKEIEAMY